MRKRNKKFPKALFSAFLALTLVLPNTASAVNAGTSDAEDVIVQMSDSKKGIQGSEWQNGKDTSTIGARHVLLNLHMNALLNGGSHSFTYGDQTYTFNASQLSGYKNTVRKLNAQGITVTLVLLMPWDAKNQDLIYKPTSGYSYYALNVENESAAQKISALFSYLAKELGQTDCHVENWILGNEVNMPNHYHYSGTLDITTNTRLYAKAMVLLDEALQKQNQAVPGKPAARAYISIDHSWTHNDEGRGIAAKDYLNAFHTQINRIKSGVNWGVALHAYAAIMDPTLTNHFSQSQLLLWGNNPFTPNNENASFVTAANLNVFTNYIKNHFGSQHRIILSEQGFDARGGEDYQAACIAYTFYAAQFNDMVDAVIFRSLKDEAGDGAFKLGIYGRKAYNVFKYMDTSIYGGATSRCLNTIGISSWKKLITNFDMPGMGFRDVNADSWYLEAVNYVNENKIMTGLNDTNFGASTPLSRAHFATVLYRMAGSPDQQYVAKFPDVPSGLFFSIPVSWAVEHQIIRGYDATGTFGSNNNINREEIVTMLYRYVNAMNGDTSQKADLSVFSDHAKVTAFAADAMAWAVAEGIIKGEGDNGLLNPQGTVSRAVCATIIQRFLTSAH